MNVSLCLASRGSRERLAPLLRSLAALRLPGPTEVLLVLNTPTPAPVDDLLPAGAAFRFEVLVEPQPGKGRALNRALRQAHGELLVFTDDDVQVDAAWLERLWQAAQRHPAIPVFGGAIRARGEVPQWIRRSVNLQGILLSEHLLGDVEMPYAFGRYPFGPNLAVRRAAVERAAARYREDVGPGTRLPVGDEGEFLSQISPPGARDRLYVPDAVVYHDVESSYFSLPNAARRTWLNGLAAGRLSVMHGSDPARASVAAQTVDRLRNIASLQEFVCNVTRACGYFTGRYLSRDGRPSN